MKCETCKWCYKDKRSEYIKYCKDVVSNCQFYDGPKTTMKTKIEVLKQSVNDIIKQVCNLEENYHDEI